ncbi:MAG TPA: NAD(P)-dependent alcohol dehydrogenase [Thermoanaerobaculia bacterium]|nr:NAD(P)-dependent alcohol dehydrogenase [Thermoanaerobaculia bacterium]
MKAAVIDGYGGVERLEVREVPRPRPGSGQLLVRVRAASVNPIDWKIRSGRLRFLKRASFPVVLGFDVAGEVAELGPEAHRFAPGDAVFAFLDSRLGGAYAEYAVVGEQAVAAKPESVSFEAAAALPVAGLTALQGLRDGGELMAGDRVLVNGGAGGVGHLAVQLAAAQGAQVSAVAGPRNQQFLRQLGAARTFDYEREDFTRGDETYDIVFDAIGNRSLRECDPVMADDGIYLTTLPGPGILLELLRSSLAGLFGPTRLARIVVVKPRGEDLATLAILVDQGKLRPAIEHTFSLDEIRQAHQASESGHTRGKVVVRIA